MGERGGIPRWKSPASGLGPPEDRCNDTGARTMEPPASHAEETA